MGPIMVVYPEGVIYMSIKTDDIAELVEEHLVKGRVLQRLLYREPTTEAVIPTMQEIPFFALQELRVLKNRGLIDPEVIELIPAGVARQFRFFPLFRIDGTLLLAMTDPKAMTRMMVKHFFIISWRIFYWFCRYGALRIF